MASLFCDLFSDEIKYFIFFKSFFLNNYFPPYLLGQHLNGIVGGALAPAGTDIDARTQCNDDIFFITSPGNPTPPAICGKNNGEHGN